MARLIVDMPVCRGQGETDVSLFRSESDVDSTNVRRLMYRMLCAVLVVRSCNAARANGFKVRSRKGGVPYGSTG